MAVLLVVVVLAKHQLVMVVAADVTAPVAVDQVVAQFLVQTNLTYLVPLLAELVTLVQVLVVVTKVVAVVVLHKMVVLVSDQELLAQEVVDLEVMEKLSLLITYPIHLRQQEQLLRVTRQINS
jgi:hypothetical protein